MQCVESEKFMGAPPSVAHFQLSTYGTIYTYIGGSGSGRDSCVTGGYVGGSEYGGGDGQGGSGDGHGGGKRGSSASNHVAEPRLVSGASPTWRASHG